MWRRLAGFVQQLPELFARETLPPAPEPEQRPTRRGFASLLFAPEPLPLDPEEPPRPRPSLLAMIFRPEPLPRDPAPALRPPRASWARWLFFPERLDGGDHAPEEH